MPKYTSHVFIDESGTAKHTPYTVYGALKSGGDLGLVVNELELLRGQSGIIKEVKFSATTARNLTFHQDIVSTVQIATGFRFTAVVVERDRDGFTGPQWKSHAYYTIEAIKLAISGDERTAATVDHISVPRTVNYEGYIQQAVNSPYQREDRRLVSVVRMQSDACWGLQVADLLAGAVHYDYRLFKGDHTLNPGSPKGQLTDHVRAAYNLQNLHSASTPRFKVRVLP